MEDTRNRDEIIVYLVQYLKKGNDISLFVLFTSGPRHQEKASPPTIPAIQHETTKIIAEGDTIISGMTNYSNQFEEHHRREELEDDDAFGQTIRLTANKRIVGG